MGNWGKSRNGTNGDHGILRAAKRASTIPRLIEAMKTDSAFSLPAYRVLFDLVPRVWYTEHQANLDKVESIRSFKSDSIYLRRPTLTAFFSYQIYASPEG